MTDFGDIHRMFNMIDADLRGYEFGSSNRRMVGGTKKPTQPYKRYKDTLDSIFHYYSDIFTTSEAKQMSYRDSVDRLSKECDCEDYKCKKDYKGIEVASSSKSRKLNIEEDEEDEEEEEDGIRLMRKGSKLY